MKKILILLAVSLGIINSNAQTRTIDGADTAKRGAGIIRLNLNDGSTYLKDTRNQTGIFIGTWVWKSGIKEFTLTLMQQNKFPYLNNRTKEVLYYADRLVGYYVYKENGKIIASTESDDLKQDYPKVYFKLGPGNKIGGLVKDYLKNKDYFPCWLTQISPDKIKLAMQEEEGVIMIFPDTDKSTLPKPGNTFPLTMELTKVK